MICNDRWIRQHCTTPVFEVREGDKHLTFLSHPYTENEKDQISRTRALEDMGPRAVRSDEHHTRTLSKVEVENFVPMISPFVAEQVKTTYVKGLKEVMGHVQGDMGLDVDGDVKKIVSYGLSSFGYDVRLANKFKIFTNVNNHGLVDPLNPDHEIFQEHEGDYCIIPPNSYVLGHTVETFSIPRDTMVICVGKSTYARCGAIVNVTPIEPGFKGQVVIEISNATPLPIKVYANQGIAQFMFFQGDDCDVSYGDRAGKYQNQSGVVTARV